jgi:hypothetical protein
MPSELVKRARLWASYWHTPIPSAAGRTAELIDELADEVESLMKGRDRLREFAEHVMDDVWQGTADDGGIQDEAERLGIIEQRDVDPDENEWGAEQLYFLRWK